MIKHFDQRGSATIGLTLVVVSLGFYLLTTIQSETLLFVKRSVDIQSRLDAEFAIDVFGSELQRAYVLGSRVADSLTGSGGEVLRYRPASQLIEYKGFKLYSPSNHKICYLRSFAEDSPAPICITLQDNLVVHRIAPDRTIEIALARQQESDRTFGQRFREAFANLALKTSQWIRMPSAYALPAPDSQWDPGDTALASLSLPVNKDFADPGFQKDYTSRQCGAGSSFDCVTVKFCVKLSQNCTNEEFITQTYIFDPIPQTELTN
jgi:hypothetical protein